MLSYLLTLAAGPVRGSQLAKWYRISLSLATKCRIGFALAVLLIIGAGLFIPYRWMDKLVEQGKLELAKTEVLHVLERHCQSPGNSELKAIPFVSGTGDEATTKRSEEHTSELQSH